MYIPESNPNGSKSEYIFLFGEYLKNMLAEFSKEGFLMENNTVKFRYPSCLVSGEIELVN